MNRVGRLDKHKYIDATINSDERCAFLTEIILVKQKSDVIGCLSAVLSAADSKLIAEYACDNADLIHVIMIARWYHGRTIRLNKHRPSYLINSSDPCTCCTETSITLCNVARAWMTNTDCGMDAWNLIFWGKIPSRIKRNCDENDIARIESGIAEMKNTLYEMCRAGITDV
jgi:hypothetical protein